MTSRSQKPASAGSARRAHNGPGRAVGFRGRRRGARAGRGRRWRRSLLTGGGGDGRGTGAPAPAPARAAKGRAATARPRRPRCSTRSSSTRRRATRSASRPATTARSGGREAGHRDDPRRSAGAEARMALDFDGAANLRIEDVTIPSATIRGPTRNLTDRRLALHRDRGRERRRRWPTRTSCSTATPTRTSTRARSCLQGRLNVVGDSGKPSGVTIRNSLFSGGNSDGVRADANGVNDHRQRVPRPARRGPVPHRSDPDLRRQAGRDPRELLPRQRGLGGDHDGQRRRREPRGGQRGRRPAVRPGR